MKKRFLSLLCVLALCLGLLPVTALAAEGAPGSLYVAGQQITDEGYYTQSGGNWTKSGDDSTPPSAPYFHYTKGNDNTPATLTLSGATIQGGTSTGSVPYGAGIYAQCNSGESVSLTIELIGENTITGYYGIYVNAEISADSYGTDASLTITGESNGSLKVSGSYHGIYVKSGTGGASLNINDASVVASSSSSYFDYAGVYVQSSAHATSSPQLSLKVNGGSLTASGTGNSDGILFYVGSSQASDATTSLTVSKNAIVDARNGGIKASGSSVSDLSDQIKVSSGDGTNGGIVFDGSTGTVYGTVELQKDLEIKSGETLTIPQGSSLNASGKLTNEGTINVESGGSVSGNLSGGTPLTTPSISQQPQSTTVTEGSTAEFSITASDAKTYQWQRKATYTESEWENISDATTTSYTTAATTTNMNGYQYRCVVTGSGGVSVISQTATLTVQAKPASVPVTGVTLDKTTLELFTGGSATLTATVQPDDATNKNVTWQSGNANVATVQNGTVNAVGAGEATITVTTEDGKKTATCKVTVTQSEYSISADTTALNFGSAYTGYTQPAAQMVTITNTGNQQVTVTLPTANDFIITAGTGFTNGSAAIEPDGTATFTVQPKAGLAVGTYSENISISGTHDVNATISATFTVKQYSSGGGTPTKTPSQQAVDKIESAKEGSTVEITLRTGQTKLDKEVFEELAGRDVTLEISLSNGVTWTVNGQDIPENADLTDLDMGVSLNTSTIPVNLINSVTGEAGTVQLTLKHNGEFGFTMTLTAPVGVKNAGLWANLYRYDDEAGSLGYEATAQVDGEGVARLPFDHASSWLVALDSRGHALPFPDALEGEWYSEAVRWAWLGGVMTGYGDGSGLFGTSSALTRAEAAVVLWRLAGEPEGASGLPADCDPSGFYAEAASWALGAGVFSGYSGDAFGPADAITREQLATVLWRAAGSPEAGGDLSSFSDAADVSDFADVAMRWAVSAGVLRGQGDGDALDPQGACTRAQLATMLYRLAAAE